MNGQILGWLLVDSDSKRFHRSAFIAFARQLGIVDSIHVSWEADITYNGQPVNGLHCHRGGVHEIQVRSGLTIEHATYVLWHELSHAQQAEAHVSATGWHDATTDELIERDADMLWNDHRHQLPIILLDVPVPAETTTVGVGGGQSPLKARWTHRRDKKRPYGFYARFFGVLVEGF